MMKIRLIALAVVVVACGLSSSASAQNNAVLAEMYGRGVHAYYAGKNTEATEYLSMAINNGIKDPRAFYFRGMVAHNSGRQLEAESDWMQGAEMEASGRTNPTIGRSLARFQGSARLKLEEIRQRARLQALSMSMSRSQQRIGEINAAQGPVSPPPPAASVVPPAAAAAAPSGAANPFADDAMAAGQPSVVADDALEGALEDPFAGDSAVADEAAAPADSNPFGGGGDAGADPFGGGGDDPFGGGGDSGDDPFGGGGDDPFGGGGDDPFGN